MFHYLSIRPSKLTPIIPHRKKCHWRIQTVILYYWPYNTAVNCFGTVVVQQSILWFRKLYNWFTVNIDWESWTISFAYKVYNLSYATPLCLTYWSWIQKLNHRLAGLISIIWMVPLIWLWYMFPLADLLRFLQMFDPTPSTRVCRMSSQCKPPTASTAVLSLAQNSTIKYIDICVTNDSSYSQQICV